MPDLARVLVGFGRALRDEGLAVGTGDMLTFCRAAARLDPADLVDVYWAGRLTLVRRREDIARYDVVFRRCFLDADDAPPEFATLTATLESAAVLSLPESGNPGEEQETPHAAGLAASTVDSLRYKAFGACTPDELAAIRRMTVRLGLTPPRRRTRRSRPARTGPIADLRATVRESLRLSGEPARLHRRRRRVRPRPLTLVLDVSGSMADYSRALLQFAYSAGRATPHVEVFCFGTRLSRITDELRTRDVDEALDRAAKAVFDWDGGTRIGASLAEFVRTWGRRGRCRGGIVVVCSDGLDRGDPDVLARAVERLARLCHRLVWTNPHPGGDSLGLSVVRPHVDVLVSGQDLRGLEELAALLPALERS
ncbi:vWA domain-containing protein [Amycolatopsis sp. NBC_01286]|uniref:vWA domain-containing protein n=1 Tax=Amycolatopsis sp. NBC_01286 TaxID=2903560 RepID=UPI002E0DBF0E|nr:VWA domain-containing protein [Amycolatopsis sp. NBC_01286]